MRTGILAEFRTPEEMLHAVHEIRRRGYRRLDAFTPYPVKGAEQAIGLPRSRINWIIFPIAMAGAGLGYLVQLYCNAHDYPIDVGGRPLHSAVAFIPITFETGVLTASTVGVFLLLLLCGLPQLYAPVFSVEGFARASIDRFWVGVDDRDPQYNPVDLERSFHDLGALRVAFAKDAGERTR
jgi:Protein of unknown function (DUF3341)